MNETFIKLVRERNKHTRKHKRDTIKIFIWLLLKEKRVIDSYHIYNYCILFYGICKNVVNEAMNELKKDNLIASTVKLGDGRKRIFFMT